MRLGKLLGRDACHALEVAAEAAHGGEVERLAGLPEGVVVHEEHRLGFLHHRLVNPARCVLLAVAGADEGEVLAGDAELMGVVLHGSLLDGVLVEQGKELAIDLVLTGTAVALEGYGVVLVYVDALDHHGVEQGVDVGVAHLIVVALQVALDVDVELAQVGKLLVGHGGDEVTEGETGAAVGDANLLIELVAQLGVGDEKEVLRLGVVEPDAERVLWHNGGEEVLRNELFLPVDVEGAIAIHHEEGNLLVNLDGGGIVERLEGVGAVEGVKEEKLLLDACDGDDACLGEYVGIFDVVHIFLVSRYDFETKFMDWTLYCFR